MTTRAELYAGSRDGTLLDFLDDLDDNFGPRRRTNTTRVQRESSNIPADAQQATADNIERDSNAERSAEEPGEEEPVPEIKVPGALSRYTSFVLERLLFLLACDWVWTMSKEVWHFVRAQFIARTERWLEIDASIWEPRRTWTDVAPFTLTQLTKMVKHHLMCKMTNMLAQSFGFLRSPCQDGSFWSRLCCNYWRTLPIAAYQGLQWISQTYQHGQFWREFSLHMVSWTMMIAQQSYAVWSVIAHLVVNIGENIALTGHRYEPLNFTAAVKNGA